MNIPPKYFRDKMALLLVAINTLLTLLIVIVILLRFDANNMDGYFVQFRANLGLNAYRVGSFAALFAFAIFAVFTMVFHLVVSIRLYSVRRQMALVVLGFGTLLLVLTMVVSNALLVLAR